MPMVTRGRTKCPICQTSIDDDYVCFTSFETDDESLKPLRDSACHYRCLLGHPKRDEVATIFLASCGEDGVRPNRTQAVSVNQNTRIVCGPILGVRLAETPAFITLEMPMSTALRWRDSDFWTMARQGLNGKFADKGFSVTVENVDGDSILRIEMCPYAYVPDQCLERSLVRKIVRRACHDVVAGFLRDCQHALAVVG